MLYIDLLDGVLEEAVEAYSKGEKEKLDARELLRIHRMEMKVDINGMLVNIEKVVEDKEKNCLVIVTTASSLERRFHDEK